MDGQERHERQNQGIGRMANGRCRCVHEFVCPTQALSVLPRDSTLVLSVRFEFADVLNSRKGVQPFGFLASEIDCSFRLLLQFRQVFLCFGHTGNAQVHERHVHSADGGTSPNERRTSGQAGSTHETKEGGERHQPTIHSGFVPIL